MPLTNVQRNAAFYARLIKEAKASPHSEKYNRVCDALEQLVETTDKLKSPYHKMSTKEYEDLVNGYTSVQSACENYLNGEEFTTFEEKRKGIITDISSVLRMDMDELSKCDSKNPGTLSEILENARIPKVVLTSKDYNKKVGNVLSSRIPIKGNGGTKGFFTAEKTHNLDDEWKKSLETYEARFGEISQKFKERLEMLKTDGDFQNKIALKIQQAPYRVSERDLVSTKKDMVLLGYELGMGETANDVVGLFSKNPDLYHALVDYSNSIIGLAKKQGIMALSGIKKGSNLSSRNCAMTDMAKLLGCSRVVAKSVPMKVEVDGKVINGVFMEAAEGTDINRLKSDDPIFRADYKSFENPEALQQLTDLQVLDFICANTDRHNANIIYEFKKKSFGGVTFAGIKGIDNDCAFGTPDVVKGKNLMQLVKLDQMKFITKDMARRLDQIKKPMLKIKLAHHHLSPEEIDAAWDRLEMVKNAVQKGKLKIVDKAYWSKNPLEKYDGAKNYISRIQDMQSACAPGDNEYLKEQNNKEINLNTNQVQYAQEKIPAAQIMSENEDALQALRAQMDDTKAKARIFNSSEYNLMKSGFEKIEKLTKEVKGYNNKKTVPAAVTDALRQAYLDLYEKTDRYISLKKLVPTTERGELRLNFAKDLNKNTGEMLKKLGVNLDKEAEKEQEDILNEDVKEVEEPALEAEV